MRNFDFEGLGKLKELFLSDKGKKIIVLIGLAGMMLILFSDCSGDKKKKANEAVTAAAQSGFAGYERELEERLGELVGNISGVGKVDVLVTIERSSEYSYVTENRNSTDRTDSSSQVTEKNDSQTQTVILSDSSGERALVRSEKAPTVKGVVIVCEGGDDPAVVQRVISAVTTALSITSDRVCVTRMTQTGR